MMNKKKTAKLSVPELFSSFNLMGLLKYLVAINVICGSFELLQVAQAQTTTTNATTDPSEAAILNSIFQRWGISATPDWNISGELCSGVAIDSTEIQTLNPAIKCSCSDRNGTLCHITGMRVYALDVVGTIPDELWNLTFLNNLNLAQNFLSGQLSADIGRLTRMQYLTVGINALSGSLPSELGLLTELIVLGFGTNNFSGPLPSSLGNLTKLNQLYFDSAGVSGAIPQTFAGIRNLVTVWASDNSLTGQIPDFVGSWSQLNTLRFQGNSFEGPIPSSFSNLTSLVDLRVLASVFIEQCFLYILFQIPMSQNVIYSYYIFDRRISDLSNGSSSLEFLANLKSLTSLTLRNSNISGSIPSNIGEYQNLTQLDLSFNNLTGDIPDSLFNLSSLTHLFLGNNKLVGLLPERKSTSLQTIDLSYNELSGSFPSWVNEDNLQMNLVANNFTIDSSNSSGLPSGLNCLQRNFPCNRGSPIYSTFAIKCGGPQITSSSQVVYETDNETLGPANYYMTGTSRWGVSNVGLPSGSSNPQYYGLGLENGNYTLNLQFAEGLILNVNPPSWRSLGRRIFDVYIQGNRVLRDFDIRKEAGGASLRAVQRTFQVQVSENFMEIHLFWAGKGTCCVPSQGTYGPSISAISATPNFEPTVSNNPPSDEKSNTGLIVGLVVGLGIFSILAVFVVYYIVQKRKKKSSYEDEEFLGMDAKPFTFSYAELKSATNDFNSDNKLGEGGFGSGILSDGRAVAVKQLAVASNQGKSQFVAEIATISAVQHKNLVKLYGCCIEGANRLLVYEYLENKSLDQALFGDTKLHLDWPTRFEICLGVARDFGLAKLYDDKKTHISTRVAGTIGYLAPEYAMRGHLTEKADVFGFGVVAMEIISGRPNSDTNLAEDKIYLLEWAWQLHESGQELELLDQNLRTFNKDEVKRVIGVALLCTQASPGLRPPMSRVVAMLSGDIEVAVVTTRPGYLTDWKFDDTTRSFMSNAASDFDTIPPDSATTSINNTNSNYSPINVDNQPILHEIIGDGR
ncbi:hypothetical protein Leryth_005121 [Lithospermum erythrorhizon]|nr:hypothetical protein Leryth_005121 [Lithospermum erythrorhizon]